MWCTSTAILGMVALLPKRTKHMAKKGRPFTYQSDEERPVTISLRVPKELHTRLDRYAKQHRQHISELLIDGIEWRIGDGDPRGLGDGTGTKNPQMYYGNTENDVLAQIRADNERVLQEVIHGFAQQESQLESLLRALERQKPLGSNGAYSSNTAIDNTVIQPRTLAQGAEPVPESTQVSGDVPPYDTSKHHLGKLCPRQHAWGTTGQSLRNADNQCLACKAQAKRAKRAQTRPAAQQEAATSA
jgi:hypothetical protein